MYCIYYYILHYIIYYTILYYVIYDTTMPIPVLFRDLKGNLLLSI